MQKFSVVTLFPEFVESFAEVGIVRRAAHSGYIAIKTFNPREFATNKHANVDDEPYGGGPGMLMTVQPLRAAIKAARDSVPGASVVAYLSPHGEPLKQAKVRQLVEINHLVLVAGRYEGIDERVIQADIDMQISLGDFILSGGEIAAIAVIDAIVRTLPGTLGDETSALNDSFSDGLLEYPQYTRPERIDDQVVPSVLLSGDHGAIARWRRKMALGRTFVARPDLIDKLKLSDEDRELLASYCDEINPCGP